MINKPFDQIGKQDLEDLVSNAVSEDRTLEYKQALPGGTDAERKEFLADVSSFANASGGDLVFGVQEKRDANGKTTGVPDAVLGLAGVNADAEVRRCENVIRDGIKPRISGIRSTPISGFVNGPAIVIRIPKSWASPHMITFKSESRFYSRTSVGKYPLDVSEIRSAFALSEELPEKLRRFRDDRLAKVIANETPVALEDSAKIVLHLLPVLALNPGGIQFEIELLRKLARNISPIGMSGYYHRINFDGLLTFSGGTTPSSSLGYVQVFRSGALEAVDAFVLGNTGTQRMIRGGVFEERLLSAFSSYIALFRELDVAKPIFVMMSVLGVKGFRMATQESLMVLDRNYPVDRDVLILPEVLLEDYEQKPDRLLRPIFDSVWQACGFDGSLNYDATGSWAWPR